MSNSIQVSVIVPCYNAGPFVAAAVESVLSQTLSEIEVICVDDGSTDNTREILTALAATDSRIRLLFAEHEGISQARNKGLTLARSEIVANLDADDVALPTRLECQWNYLKLYEECIAVGTQALQMTSAGEALGPLTSLLKHEEIERELLQGRGFALIHTSAMFRKSAIEKVGGYDEQLPFAVDLDLYLKLAEVGRLANLEETLVLVRRHALSTTAVDDRRRGFQVKQQVLEAAYRRRGLPLASIALWPMKYPNTSAELYASHAVMAIRHGYYRTFMHCTGRMCRAMLAERRGIWSSLWRFTIGIGSYAGRCIQQAILGNKSGTNSIRKQAPS